ncbi:MAG: BON domain-containing protein [Alphaproteobacteria bacterium]|nr:BON domain-containing protein [Alphaproteobacteria bacterium]
MSHTKLFAAAALAGFLAMAGAAQAAESAGQYIDDATITTKVKAVILADAGLKGTDISVDTSHGTVDLHGTVGSASQSSLAASDAAKVDGVKAVTNDLTVGR